MTQTTYNGWTNYATWRIALEIFDGENPFDYETDTYTLSRLLYDYVSDYLSENCLNQLTNNYAMAFIDNVNWYEIAEHLIQEVANEN
jgi:hypothetical protein